MAPTYLEPTISPTSPAAANYQSAPSVVDLAPENHFERTLSEAWGTAGALSFLAGDGLAYANSQDPSFGGTVVSTAISNLGNGSPFFTYGTGASGAGSSYGTGAYGAGYGGGGGLSGYGAGLNSGAPVPLAGQGGMPNVGAAAGTSPDGLNSGDVRQTLVNEGLSQILLMVEVQRATRYLDTISNIYKAWHDANVNTIRNIRS